MHTGLPGRVVSTAWGRFGEDVLIYMNSFPSSLFPSATDTGLLHRKIRNIPAQSSLSQILAAHQCSDEERILAVELFLICTLKTVGWHFSCFSVAHSLYH